MEFKTMFNRTFKTGRQFIAISAASLALIGAIQLGNESSQTGKVISHDGNAPQLLSSDKVGSLDPLGKFTAPILNSHPAL
jgi:hypothetical protein